MAVKLTLLSAGYCLGRESHTLRGGRRSMLRFPALFALLEHPSEGYLLFDTGYTRRFLDATKRFPNRFYNLLTPVSITDEQTALAKLGARGIAAGQIRHVLVSHLHADHIAGARDFPGARFICSAEALAFARTTRGLRALRAGFIPELLPDDFFDRAVGLSTSSAAYQPDPFWGYHYDLFGDGLLKMVALPGHARGQLGVLVRTEEREVLLAADVCWHSLSFREMVLPPVTARLIMDSWREFRESLERVHRYHRMHPDTLIVPSHCQEIFETYIRAY